MVSGPPDPLLDGDIPVHRLPCLDLYNPDDLFRIPSLKELADPINLIEWLGVSTMGFPEPFTFGLRAFLYLRNTAAAAIDIIHDNQSLSYGIWALAGGCPPWPPSTTPSRSTGTSAVHAVRSFLGKNETAALVLADRHAKTGGPRTAAHHHRVRMRPGRHLPGIRHSPKTDLPWCPTASTPACSIPLPGISARAGPDHRHQQRGHPSKRALLPAACRGRHCQDPTASAWWSSASPKKNGGTSSG